MSSVCYEYDCKYNKPKWQTKKRSRQPLPGGHCKIGRSEGVSISGRCILGLAKRTILCPLREEEEYSDFERNTEQNLE